MRGCSVAKTALGETSILGTWPSFISVVLTQNKQTISYSFSKDGLFRMSRELKVKACKLGGQHADPPTAREGEAFIEGKRKLGGGLSRWRWW